MFKKVATKVGKVRRDVRVLYPSKANTSAQKVPVVGGTPITLELAVDLRTAVFGSSALMGAAESEWLGEAFQFHDADTFRSYALSSMKESTRGLIMCVQGYVLKHLLFTRKGPRMNQGDPSANLKVAAKAQEDALVAALSDILWKAGDKTSAVLCLVQDEAYIIDSASFQTDKCTEKIHTFDFKKQDDLTINIKRYLYQFISADISGLLLFLYSLVLSRGFERLTEDMDESIVNLVQKGGAIHPCLATLILTGRATHYLHNGIVYEGNEDTMAKARTGILTRSEIGLLEYQKGSDLGKIIGSRLKTPSLPMWVARSDDQYGILFNPSRDLIRDYHAENRFDLYYHCGHFENGPTTTMITVDTRNAMACDADSTPTLDNIIHAKWAGAVVNWNGAEPFM